MPVPGTPIGELKGWQLDIRCSRCRRHVQLNVADVVARYPGTVRIGDVLRRLRCGGFRDEVRCNGRPSRVKLAEVSTYGKSMRKLRQVTVMG